MKKLTILMALCLLIGLLGHAQQSATMTMKNSPKTGAQAPLPQEPKFKLVPLPYATDALAPIISKRTIELHHGKHLQGYVDNLNKLIEGTEFMHKDLVTIVRESDGALFNNAGQNLNHILYFLQFSPNGGGSPKGSLLEAIDRTYGSFEAFKTEFERAALSVFGSGWAWLACTEQGKLEIIKESNAGNPVTQGLIPLLGIDVWEHAYYLDYENKRGEHLKKVWNIIDWSIVAQRYEERKIGVKLE